ncbi:ANTAR domain-containing protein [Desertihabitans brevis]|uniref:ANTAR domain-containing protein n=1 Tax=Desertihabitans brevis TaxID=2268447 RepID=A0A367YRN5_9ACTN|nr:ANTAR domain-containing protein [Desertihabitans brevis]RCK68407.1 ANTAR domain-containing protein [Desertihabitans brevis]
MTIDHVRPIDPTPRQDVRRPPANDHAELLPAAEFRANLDQDCWWWSGGLYALLGLREGSLVPTTEVLLHHVDPLDRPQVRELLAEPPAGATSLRLRLRTRGGRVRTMVLTIAPDHSTEAQDRPSWLGCTLVGTLVDVTASERHLASRAVHDATLHRDVVEQAKGIAMSAFGLSEDCAFLLLSYFCRSRNLELHEVAQQLVDQVTELDADQELRRRVEQVLAGHRLDQEATG